VDDGVATDDDLPTFADAVPCARAVDRLRALPLVPYD